MTVFQTTGREGVIHWNNINHKLANGIGAIKISTCSKKV